MQNYNFVTKKVPVVNEMEKEERIGLGLWGFGRTADI